MRIRADAEHIFHVIFSTKIHANVSDLFMVVAVEMAITMTQRRNAISNARDQMVAPNVSEIENMN